MIIAIAVAGESVHAQSTWHVDASVCPAVGTGTQTDPFCKIQDTLSAAAGEDEVLVRPSEYVETLFNLIKPITLRSTGGAEQTIVTGVLVPLWSLTAW